MSAASEWKKEPFTGGLPLPYEAEFSADEWQRMQDGFAPEAMEDKWVVHHVAPYLYFHRSWTGEPVYRIELHAWQGGARVVEALWSTPLACGRDREFGYEAKLLHFLVGNLLLGKREPFPVPENMAEPIPGIYQHHVAGTGYPEVTVPVPARRPWWKLWTKGQ